MSEEIKTVGQLRGFLSSNRFEFKNPRTPLRELGLQVERISPYGVCHYCKKKVGKEYNCCPGCADERGP